MGIANSIDLPFKKKHSAIAMRNVQLLFEPYEEEDIQDILEQKVNSKFESLNPLVKTNKELKDIFLKLIQERSYLFIAKKVAKMNGDIRVAFDMMKSALMLLSKEIRDTPGEIPNNKYQVTYQTLLKVHEIKYGSRISTTIKSLTRQHILVLNALCELFE